MAKLWEFLDEHAEDYILVVLMSVMTVVIFIQVLMRYVFKNSLSWSEELARYLFVWLSYLSISYGIKNRKHVKIEAALHLFPKKLRPYVVIIGDMVTLIWSIFVVTTGWVMTQKVLASGQTSPAMSFPMYIIYFAPCLGYMLSAIRTVQTIALRVGNIRKGVEMSD